MKKIPFWKMSGSGNDFVLIDNRKNEFPRTVSAWAKRLCHRQEGVGADGLLLLEKSRKADFRMVYYNADGSRASMCGNGARCMAWFAKDRGLEPTTFRFETDAGLVEASVHDHVAQITMGEARDYKPDLIARTKSGTYPVAFLNTGVPHAVCFVPNLDSVDVTSIGRELRYHPIFGPAGTNVNFVQRRDPHSLKVRTYERGVEGETLACGTGVVASAIAAHLKGWTQQPIRCLTAGGDTLEVRFEAHFADPKRPATQVSLKGPVRLTFTGEIKI